nr:alpha/beta hydrolase [Motilibacter peucedani]
MSRGAAGGAASLPSWPPRAPGCRWRDQASGPRWSGRCTRRAGDPRSRWLGEHWDLVLPLLTAGVRTVALDLPAHGGSRPGAGPTLDDAQRVVAAVADWAALHQPVTLLAHSFGATVALRWAATAPQRVSRLLVLAPPVPRAAHYDLGIAAKQLLLRLPGVEGVVSRQQRAASPRELVDRQLRQATPHPERVPESAVSASADDVALCRSRGWEPEAQHQQWRMILETMTLLRDGAAYARSLAELDVPGGWLHGDADPLSRLTAARRLADSQPRWPFHVIGGAGHVPHVERPREVAAELDLLLR